MILVWALLLAAATIGYSDGAATPRIIGGEPTSIYNYPSVAQVEFRGTLWGWSQTCGATIITRRYALSVAQCFTGFLFSTNQRRLRVGTTYRGSGGYIVGIINALNHWTYHSNTHEGDISILQMEYRLTFDLDANAAVLPPQGMQMFDGAPVTVLGWGATYNNGPSSYELRKVTLYTVNHDVCVDRYYVWPQRPSDVSYNMLCTALLDSSDRDICDGDAGGPVFLNNNVLMGIISWGATCGNAYLPLVNTKVSHYRDWINDTIGVGDWI